MSIEKKSLISTLKTTKKANAASSTPASEAVQVISKKARMVSKKARMVSKKARTHRA